MSHLDGTTGPTAVARSGSALHAVFGPLADSIREGLVMVDLDGRITGWNAAAARLYGYGADEVLGRSVRILVTSERADEPFTIIQRIRAGEESVSIETRRARKDGQVIECSLSAFGITDEQGTLSGVYALVADLTAHRQMSRALQERETQLQGLFEQSVSGVFIVSAHGQIRYINSGFTRLFGYAPEELIGEPLLEFVSGPERPAVAEAIRRALSGVTLVTETQLMARDGSMRTVLAQATRVQHDGVPALIGVVMDLTEHKRTEVALSRANRLLRTIGAANEALVRAESEARLVDSMSEVLVHVGGMRAVQIGVVDPQGACQMVVRAREPAAAGGSGARTETFPCTVVDGQPRFDAERAFAWLPLSDEERTIGCLGLHLPDNDPLGEDELKLLTELADDLAYGLIALRHRRDHEASAERLQRSMEETVAALAATLEARDPYTAGHQRRVADLATAIAHELGLDQSRVHAIRLAAVVHDIGKIKIPSELLVKPSALTPVEELLIQTHAEAGFDILKGIDFPWPIAEMVRQHHERLDGTGYPHGLRAEDILIEARVLAVADHVEAMAADRPYRYGRGIAAALAVIEAERGTRFDAEIVDACLRLFREHRFSFPSHAIAAQ